jgi:TatD DNase family protein
LLPDVECQYALSFEEALYMLAYLKGLSVRPRGIIHCSTGSAEVVREYVRMGYYVSFAGPLTFKKAPNLWEAAKVVPLDRLLVETDSPYLSPEPKRGRRNEPGHTRFVLEKLAQLKELSAQDMARITTENAMRVYEIG